MAERQLFCVAEDRHRATLLVQLLDELSCPTLLVSEPPVAPPGSTLVLWTHNAAAEPWIARLFQDPDAVALVLDGVGLPARCARAVDLSSWPARSADAQIGELARWLTNPAGNPGFARVSRRAASAEPGSGSAVLVLVLVVVLLGLLVWSVGSDDDGAAAAGRPDNDVVLDDSDTAALPGMQPDRSPVGSSSAPRSQDVDEPPRVVGSGVSTRPGRSEGTGSGSGAVAASELTGRPAEERIGELGNGSLAHLCRARSLAAARAWYGVLTAQQRRRAATMGCVRALLAKPQFSALREMIQA